MTRQVTTKINIKYSKVTSCNQSPTCTHNMMNVIMFQYHVTAQSATQYGKVTSHIYSLFRILHSDNQLDHKTLQHNQSLYHTSITTASLSLSFSPPMDTSEVCVEILHVAERVVCLHTPQNPAEKWAFPLRVGCTGTGMRLHTLLESITFAAVWAHEGFIRFRVILSMGNFVMLPHPLAACKVPVTVRALHPPCTQAGWWECSIHQDANTFPHFSHGNFSP